MVDVGIDEAVSFVVLMNNIKSLSIPKSKEKPCPVFRIVAEDSMQTAKFVLQVAHLICCRVNLLECAFSLKMKVFA